MTGEAIVRASWAATGALFVAAVVGVLFDGAPRAASAVVAVALFAAGVVCFGWAYAVAVGRSRTVEIGIGGLFFLAGDVGEPRPRRHLRLALAVQVVVALVAASLRPFTSLAFMVLAPVVGLSLMGLWGARHGTFGPRAVRGGPPTLRRDG